MKKKLFSVFLVFALCFVPMLLAVPTFAASEPADTSDPVVLDQAVASPLYQSAYDLFREYIYGSDTVLSEHMELTLTILATLAAVFVVSLPFVVVFFIIKLVAGR